MSLRRLFFFFAVLSGCLVTISPGRAAATYTPLPPDLDGSMMPLDVSRFTQPVTLPDSLRPVYAAYVSRHGARYLSGPKKIDALFNALQRGVNTGTLSAEGEAFFLLVKQIIAANEGNWGDLSPIGSEEQKIMGRRVFGMLTPLGRGGAGISGISSYVPRCVMTMYEFSNQLIRCNDSVRVATDEGHQFSPLLCFFATDREYADYRDRGDWKAVYDDFVARRVEAAPARRLFTSTPLSDRELRAMTVEMYEVLKGNRAAGLPAPTTRWMSEAEYRACWEADNLRHYLRNTITPLSSLAARAASPLVREIIGAADRALDARSPRVALDGYFGHAETLLPLLSLLKIPGCFALPHDYDNLDKEWRLQEITPLGANLLMLFSKGPSGKAYVSLQLNGRSVRPMVGRPDIVAWSDLRAYWFDLLEGYGLRD